MLAAAMSRRLTPRGLHFSWVIAGLTFLTMLFMSAALGLPGAMLQPLAQEFGWSTSQISSALALRFALFGLMGPFAAVLMERFGVRAVVSVALGLVGGGMLLAGLVTQLWHLVVLWGVVLGLGSGMTALVLGAIVSNRWFAVRKGLIMGILTASAATGQLICLPIAAWMIERWGWRAPLLPLAVLCLVVMSLVLLFMRDRPSDLGLAPYGADPATAAAPAAPAAKVTWRTPFAALREASTQPTFWLLFGTFFICGLSTNGLVQTHFISLCGDYGLAAVPAASVLAMMGIFDFIGTIASGWLSDRYDARKLLCWYYALRGLSLMWLPNAEFTLYGLSLFAVFYGLDWIATVPPTVRLTAERFGAAKVGMVFGWIFAGHQIGAAVAAYGAGLSRSLLLSYAPALYVAGAACLLAAAMAMVIRRKTAAA
ncbi:MFS transporter [Mitsuaria sp. GD03876]|uniref:MFS transporter n=1 Tax=Mitsuaria sp. GD03876 TaxID=2975399 RepID=UPI002448065C|nr:MFS transporter [Mitsuaria sp. GD03876]MDH0866712.1 MFS transporter [Mitsuaria sp. GD03876]